MQVEYISAKPGKAMYARYAQALGQPEPDPDEHQGYYLVEMGRAAAGFGDKYLHVDQAVGEGRLALTPYQKLVLAATG